MAYLKIDEIEDVLVKAVERGLTKELACKCAGISNRAFWDWMKQGRKDDEAGVESRYSLFYRKIQKAKGICADRYMEAVEKAALHAEKPQWTAAAWILERRFDEYKNKMKVDISGLSFEDALSYLPEDYAESLRSAIKAKLAEDMKKKRSE